MRALPDFLIIGAMKSGTSSLFAWLADQQEVAVPSIKEPNFFSDDSQWNRGWTWYRTLFEHANGRLSGEASVSYTDPERAATAAERIARSLPEIRLVYLIRHPLHRLASEYRHQVQRGRESRPFAEATAQPSTSYAARSRYFTCVRPYIERFPKQQLLIIRSEDLAGAGWASAITHLGLTERSAPSTSHNVTQSKRGYNRLMRWLYDHDLTTRLERLPAPLRRVGRGMLFRSDAGYDQLLTTSHTQVSTETADSIWADVAQLESWLGVGRLWER